GKSILRELSKKAEPWISMLDDIEAGLEKATTERLTERWKTFFTQANQINEAMFAQYIEFIGGLALRDAGFDEGISRLANELLRGCCTRNPEALLAIPTRQSAVAMTMTRIIRVTFPDWTIWALPSTALEFWHVVAKQELADKV